MNSDILRGTMLLESPLLNYHVSQGGSFFEMPSGPSTRRARPLARERNLPYWSAEFRFWGPPKLIDAQWEYVKENSARSRARRSPTAAAMCFRPRSIRTTRRSPSRSASRRSACSACCKAAATSVSRRSFR